MWRYIREGRVAKTLAHDTIRATNLRPYPHNFIAVSSHTTTRHTATPIVEWNLIDRLSNILHKFIFERMEIQIHQANTSTFDRSIDGMFDFFGERSG